MNTLKKTVEVQNDCNVRWFDHIAKTMIGESEMFHALVKSNHAEFVDHKSRVNNTIGIITNQMRHFEEVQDQLVEKVNTSPSPRLSCGGSKAPAITARLIKESGILFDEEMRYFPHLYTSLFTNFIKNADLTPEQVCAFFKINIEVVDAAMFKQDHLHITDIKDLVEAFYEEFWSDRVQEIALQRFKNISPTASSVKNLISTIKRWLTQLMYAKKADERELIAIAHKKLPPPYISLVSATDLMSMSSFTQRLDSFVKAYDPGAVRAINLQTFDSAVKRFSHPDYAQPQAVQKPQPAKIPAKVDSRIPQRTQNRPLPTGAISTVDEFADDANVAPEQIPVDQIIPGSSSSLADELSQPSEN